MIVKRKKITSIAIAANYDSTRYCIQKLNGDNYQLWQHKVKMMFIRDKTWPVINEAEKKEGDDDYAEWLEKDASALAAINMLVEDSQLVHIMDATKAKEAWDILKDYNQKSSLSSRVYLQRKLYNLHLPESGNMEEHITEFLMIVNKLSATGKKFDDFDLACTLLCSLPESYNTLVTSLEGRSEKEITLDLVKGKLIGESNNRSNKQVFVRENYEERETAMKVTDFSNKNVECFWCRCKGHYKRECKDYQEWRERKERRQDRADVARGETNERASPVKEFLFKVHVKETKAYDKLKDKNVWVIDSGATRHITNNKAFFHSLERTSGKVVVANNQEEAIVGRGTGTLKCAVNERINNIKVADVLYVPNLSVNLLSVRVLDSKGFEINFKDGYAIIQKDGIKIASARECNGIYILCTDKSSSTKMRQDNQNMSIVEFPAYNPPRKIVNDNEIENEETSDGGESDSSDSTIVEVEIHHEKDARVRRSERSNKGVPPIRHGTPPMLGTLDSESE